MQRNGNATTLKVSIETGGITTSAGGVAAFYLRADPEYYLSTQMGAIANTFQYYKYRSWTATWVPLLGATSGGVVKMACSDNPEVLYNIGTNYVSADYNTLASQLPTAKRVPIWQEQSYSIPSMYLNRRVKYTIDSTMATSAEVSDRATQSAFFGYVTGPASTTCGYFTIDATLDLFEVIPVTGTPLFTSVPTKHDDAIDPQVPESPPEV